MARVQRSCDRGPNGQLLEEQRWARQRPEYWAEKLKLEAADAVADALAEQGINRVELARRLGASPSLVTKILSGYQNLSLESLAKLGCALGVQWQLVSAPIDSVPSEGAAIQRLLS